MIHGQQNIKLWNNIKIKIDGKGKVSEGKGYPRRGHEGPEGE
jgi:hypothetical protein